MHVHQTKKNTNHVCISGWVGGWVDVKEKEAYNTGEYASLRSKQRAGSEELNSKLRQQFVVLCCMFTVEFHHCCGKIAESM